MIDAYNKLPPEEQKIVLVTVLAGAASLWLAVAWEEPMVLIALPLLWLIGRTLMRSARRRAQRQEQDWLY
jgi:hypothetical protein